MADNGVISFEIGEILSGRLRASARVRNGTADTWSRDGGFLFGYQILDPETLSLLVEGERVTFPEDIAASQEADAHISIVLPAQPGQYRVMVSPLKEHEFWLSQKGAKFLAIDVTVDSNGEARVDQASITKFGRVQWTLLGKALKKALTRPWVSLWRNRTLSRSLVKRDILGRYRGSLGGGLWTVLNPLLLMLTYFFVFGVVLQSRIENDPRPGSFALYFLAGMLPWLAFSEALGRAPFVVTENRGLIKKLVFPIEILPFNTTLAALVGEAFAFLLYTIGLLLLRGSLPITILWLPVILIPQILLTAGLSWILSALGAFFRDLGQIMGFLITIWFFITPICYQEHQVPARLAGILHKNPAYVMVRAYRQILLEGVSPLSPALAKFWLLSLLIFLAGFALFYRLRRVFADVI